MTNTATQTDGTGKATGTATPPATPPATTGRDTYGEKRLNLSNVPVIGYTKAGKFTPVTEGQKPENQEPPKDQAPQTPPADTEDSNDENGQPADDNALSPENTSVLKAQNGKTFKDAAELLTTYDTSATEAVRLAGETKTTKIAMEDMNGKVQAANATILAMQEYINNAAYMPNVPEKYKGMTESEMISSMTEDEKLDYQLDKREWKKKVDSFKTQMSKAKDESESLAKAVTAEMARVEQAMSKDPVKYPDFAVLEPLRAEILKESPHLANRPDSPYVAFYMAHGILALKEKEETARLEADSRNKAAETAKAEAANGGGGAPPKADDKSAPKDDGLRGLVKAAKATKGTF